MSDEGHAPGDEGVPAADDVDLAVDPGAGVIVPDPSRPTSTDDPGPKALDKKHLARLTGPIIALVVCTNLGNFFFAQLSTENPLLLIALNASNRNLIIASNNVPLAAYFVVAFVRLLAPDPFFYALGVHYGDRAITWMERRTATIGSMMRQLESVFGKYGHVLVVIMPNNPVCLLAGAARMKRPVFWTLNVIGTIGRLIIMWWIGAQFQDAIDVILKFISDHRLIVFLITAGLTTLTLVMEFRSGSSEIQQLMELEDELATDGAHAKGDRDGDAA